MSRLLEFEKLHNIRDLGGMPTLDGRVIAGGRLIRCGHLAEIGGNDKKKLGELLGVAVDFRTDGERAEKPDAEIPGVKYYHIPILDSLTAGISREAEADRDLLSRLVLKPAEAKRHMCDMYRAFAENEFSVSQYGKFIGILLEGSDRAVLWHCTAGKDRAGIGAVIIEEILGVPKDVILSDYLKTNDYLKADIRFLTEFVKKQAGTDSVLADEALGYLFGAQEEYIAAFYETVEKKYGGFDAFIRLGLCVTDEKRDELRKNYLKTGREAGV